MTDKKLTKEEEAFEEAVYIYTQEVVELYDGDYTAINTVINGHIRLGQSATFFRAVKKQLGAFQDHDVMSRMDNKMKQHINREMATWGGVVLQLDEEGEVMLINISNLEFRDDGTVIAFVPKLT